MANKQRGEVEFTDGDGKAFVLKLGANQMATHQDELDKLNGVKSLRRLLQIALEWKEDQKGITLEQVGDLIDDLGIDRMNELIEQTRWGAMAKEAGDKAKLAKLIEERAAVIRRIPGMPNENDTRTLADLNQQIKELEKSKKTEGSANPPVAVGATS